MPSSRRKQNPRRQMFLKLSGMIEGQLRDAYAKRYEAGVLNQSSLAAKLEINRSAIHHRLTGQKNMTIETIADMVWGLDHDIEVKIFDPSESLRNDKISEEATPFRPTSSPDTVSPLMQIASTAPSSNTAPLSILGGVQKRVTSDAAQSYRSQLIGSK